MVQLSDHPTVQRMRAAPPKDTAGPALPLDADWLRMLCLEAGADDVGFVPVDHPDLAAHRSDVLTLFPAGKALISIVCRMNRENIRTPMRSIANLSATPRLIRKHQSKDRGLKGRAFGWVGSHI